MSSKALRKQPSRLAQQSSSSATNEADAEVAAKRAKRRLEDLERSNYTEPKDRLPGIIDDDDEDGDRTGTGRPVHRARDTLNLRNDGKQKRKSTAAVRQILLYRKTFNTLLEESGLADQPGPNYLTAVAPPPTYPPRSFCQVCGYFGNYNCKKCSVSYCSIPCRDTHDETGCERRLIA